jgi:hypothetical protein
VGVSGPIAITAAGYPPRRYICVPVINRSSTRRSPTLAARCRLADLKPQQQQRYRYGLERRVSDFRTRLLNTALYTLLVADSLCSRSTKAGGGQCARLLPPGVIGDGYLESYGGFEATVPAPTRLGGAPSAMVAWCCHQSTDGEPRVSRERSSFSAARPVGTDINQ